VDECKPCQGALLRAIGAAREEHLDDTGTVESHRGAQERREAGAHVVAPQAEFEFKSLDRA